MCAAPARSAACGSARSRTRAARTGASTSSSTDPRGRKRKAPMVDFKREALVSTAWLADNLGAPDLRVVDASYYLPNEGTEEHGRAQVRNPVTNAPPVCRIRL